VAGIAVFAGSRVTCNQVDLIPKQVKTRGILKGCGLFKHAVNLTLLMTLEAHFWVVIQRTTLQGAVRSKTEK
jgi:hypothetical protein